MGTLACIALYCWYILPLAIDETELDTKPKPSKLAVEHQYPALLINATLAAEDKRFYTHGGVDLFATARAIKDAIRAKRFVSGASTITQQTVKLLSDTPPRTLETKVTEALKARNLEMSHDKDTILYTYFELLEYGNQTRGPQQAADHYFDKPLEALTLAEAALLAGLPQAPSRLNPRRNPESALKRRNWVLERMQIVFDYTEDEILAAQQAPLGITESPNTLSNAIALKQASLK